MTNQVNDQAARKTLSIKNRSPLSSSHASFFQGQHPEVEKLQEELKQQAKNILDIYSQQVVDIDQNARIELFRHTKAKLSDCIENIHKEYQEIRVAPHKRPPFENIIKNVSSYLNVQHGRNAKSFDLAVENCLKKDQPKVPCTINFR